MGGALCPSKLFFFYIFSHPPVWVLNAFNDIPDVDEFSINVFGFTVLPFSSTTSPYVGKFSPRINFNLTGLNVVPSLTFVSLNDSHLGNTSFQLPTGSIFFVVNE